MQLTKAQMLTRLMPKGALVDTGTLPVYPAAAQGVRRTLGWRSPTTYPNQILEQLVTLRDRSRAAYRANGFATGSIEALVSNIVGYGIKPLSKAENPEFKKALQELWDYWVCESDADGVLSWYGQQQQATRCWLEAGEVFVRLRPRLPVDGLTVPLQLQVLEPEMCPHNWSGNAPNGNRIRAGIEFNAIGKRVAYYFYASRPGDPNDFEAAELRRIPAEQVLHVYKPLRAGQLRGLPILTQALVRLREVEKYDDATLLRQQMATMFVAFLRNMNQGNVDALTGGTLETDGQNRPLVSLEPGTFQELAPGEDVAFAEPPAPPLGYGEYMRQQLMAVSASTGVPYEVLTGDMSKVNDRTVRVILSEFRRKIQTDQHETIIHQLCRPVWYAWLDRIFLAGALPIGADYLQDPEPYAKAKWTPQGWPYINPVQDVEAQRKAIRAGFTSRQAVVSEHGDDAEVIDAEQAEDNARADELELVYESDGRQPEGGGEPTPAPAPGGGAPPAPGQPEPEEPEEE